MKKKILSVLTALAALTLLTIPCFSTDKENDMSLTYLSDMEWKAASIYPDANKGVPTRDENLSGEELWLCEDYFEKGVCFHANMGKIAYLEVDIEGKGFKTFLCYVGTAESELYDVSMASVRFTFKCDGQTKVKTEVITPRNCPQLVCVDVTGCKILRIEVDDGGDGISGDWGALGYAVFSDKENADEILAELAPETTAPQTETEPVTETETEKETETETETEKVIETEEETEPETTNTAYAPKKSEFPVIPVIIGAAAAVCAATVIAIIFKRRKK